MKISVIIPVYNTEKFIERTIDSILSQDYKDFEIICIDDGSKDRSADIIKEKAKINPCIKYYYQKNQGPGAARKKGLSLASGKLIHFMDSDDYLIDNLAFSKVIAIYKDYNPDVLFFDLKIKRAKEELISKPFNINESNRGYNKLEKMVNIHISASLCSKILKRSILVENMFINSNTFEDFYTSYLYLDKCKNYYYLDETLYCVYHGEDNNSHLSLVDNIEKEKKRLDIINLAYSSVNSSIIKKCIANYCIQVIIAEITFRTKKIFDFKYMHSRKLLKSEIKGIVNIINDSKIVYVPNGKFKVFKKILFKLFLLIHK